MKRNSSEEKGDAWLRHILVLSAVEGATHLLTHIKTAGPMLARRAWWKELWDRVRMRPLSARWEAGAEVQVLQIPCQMQFGKPLLFWAPGVQEWVPELQGKTDGVKMIHRITASQLNWRFTGSSPVGYMQRGGWEQQDPKVRNDMPVGVVLVNHQPLGLQLVMRKGAPDVKTIPALPWEPQAESDEVELDASLVDLSNVSQVDMADSWWLHTTPWGPVEESEEAVEEAVGS